MAAKPQCEVDFSDSDFLVSQMEGKARLSQIRRKQAAAVEPAASAQTMQQIDATPRMNWLPVVGKLLVLIPLALLVWFLLASR